MTSKRSSFGLLSGHPIPIPRDEQGVGQRQLVPPPAWLVFQRYPAQSRCEVLHQIGHMRLQRFQIELPVTAQRFTGRGQLMVPGIELSVAGVPLE